MFDLVPGDFNINALTNGDNLRNTFSEYELVNRDPTHISRCLY